MELKDCPFCGSKCGTNITANGKSYYAFCPNCMACSDIFDLHDDAVKAWNRRASPWIRFEDRKPEEGQVCVFYWIDSDDLETWKYRKSGMSQNRPSHWMPVPEVEEV